MPNINPYVAPQAKISHNNHSTCDKTILFSMNQRIGRLRYLTYIIVPYFISIFGLNLSSYFLSPEILKENRELIIIVILIIMLLNFSSLMISSVRRLHDLNHSGWFVITMIIPFIGLITFIYLVFFAGTKGNNNFGLQPAKNSKLVVFIGILLPLLAALGIIAAILLPIYQDYYKRNKIEQMEQSMYFTDQIPIINS